MHYLAIFYQTLMYSQQKTSLQVLSFFISSLDIDVAINTIICVLYIEIKNHSMNVELLVFGNRIIEKKNRVLHTLQLIYFTTI